MSDIVKSQSDEVSTTFPSKSESNFQEIIFLDPIALMGKLQGWEAHGAKGADTVASAILIFSMRLLLEEEHPFKRKGFKSDRARSIIDEYWRVRNFEETDNLFNKTTYPYRAKMRAGLYRKASVFFKHFLTPRIRELAVRQHARGMSTANVARYLISPVCEEVSIFHHFIAYEAELQSKVIQWLTPRLAYLKVGAHGFPQKYQELWESEREAYISEISSVPLTDTAEQVKALSDLYERLDDAFNESETEKGKAMLAKAMVQTMSGLFTLTREQNMPAFPKTKTQK